MPLEPADYAPTAQDLADLIEQAARLRARGKSRARWAVALTQAGRHDAADHAIADVQNAMDELDWGWREIDDPATRRAWHNAMRAVERAAKRVRQSVA